MKRQRFPSWLTLPVQSMQDSSSHAADLVWAPRYTYVPTSCDECTSMPPHAVVQLAQRAAQDDIKDCFLWTAIQQRVRALARQLTLPQWTAFLSSVSQVGELNDKTINAAMPWIRHHVQRLVRQNESPEGRANGLRRPAYLWRAILSVDAYMKYHPTNRRRYVIPDNILEPQHGRANPTFQYILPNTPHQWRAFLRQMAPLMALTITQRISSELTPSLSVIVAHCLVATPYCDPLLIGALDTYCVRNLRAFPTRLLCQLFHDLARLARLRGERPSAALAGAVCERVRHSRGKNIGGDLLSSFLHTYHLLQMDDVALLRQVGHMIVDDSLRFRTGLQYVRATYPFILSGLLMDESMVQLANWLVMEAARLISDIQKLPRHFLFLLVAFNNVPHLGKRRAGDGDTDAGAGDEIVARVDPTASSSQPVIVSSMGVGGGGVDQVYEGVKRSVHEGARLQLLIERSDTITYVHVRRAIRRFMESVPALLPSLSPTELIQAMQATAACRFKVPRETKEVLMSHVTAQAWKMPAGGLPIVLTCAVRLYGAEGVRRSTLLPAYAERIAAETASGGLEGEGRASEASSTTMYPVEWSHLYQLEAMARVVQVFSQCGFQHAKMAENVCRFLLEDDRRLLYAPCPTGAPLLPSLVTIFHYAASQGLLDPFFYREMVAACLAHVDVGVDKGEGVQLVDCLGLLECCRLLSSPTSLSLTDSVHLQSVVYGDLPRLLLAVLKALPPASLTCLDGSDVQLMHYLLQQLAVQLRVHHEEGAADAGGMNAHAAVSHQLPAAAADDTAARGFRMEELRMACDGAIDALRERADELKVSLRDEGGAAVDGGKQEGGGRSVRLREWREGMAWRPVRVAQSAVQLAGVG
ncbi:unnamed protein product [Vitrella brassicaformis CCMP3155]|uniref:Uncharacterized protein n=1 Tax=Vitrella brassicaformis (strain CCMP3155) TaxID=1169540 RepID=A0A0G4FBT1_VITBC|nr:unnamed protein product [Vitrella brassicaformis CCMP3155]|eukprot:CEM10516.1 unnamed protein product [Vitrella brassicaformis CCMP3155]